MAKITPIINYSGTNSPGVSKPREEEEEEGGPRGEEEEEEEGEEGTGELDDSSNPFSTHFALK